MTKIAYFDCLSGISGDMTLGALIDIGAQTGELDANTIQSAVRSMGLGEITIQSETVKKKGFRAIKVDIAHPPEHAHRHLHHITEMIDRADAIAPEAKQLAHKIFLELAKAEAKVHGSTIEKVHFHEVGAIDSIADIVGTAVAMTQLGIDSVEASPVPTGSGTITIAHGRVAIPAPATAELLKGIPIATSDVQAELTTPTGAAILKATATRFGSIPSMSTIAVGYGAGTKDLEAQANILKVMLGERTGQTASSQETARDYPLETDQVVVLETNIDDASPQSLAFCADRLFDAGALDVFQTPCVMKKGRLGVVLTTVCDAEHVAQLESILFTHTSSIGIRRHTSNRRKLVRRSETVSTEFGAVRGKVVIVPGGSERFAVEDDDAVAMAKQHSVDVNQVRAAAQSAWKNNKS
ncbi:nickel pincer cofactor biosynthesis protein LarC [Novipirellula caenicola]|uniref:Putative nickel insertion protein n=1 Tax=Novipirellula caenicola TaxID=1536901 RepID=A0ABP9W1B3_9BACT